MGKKSKDEALRQLGESIEKYNKQTKERKDIDQATKDKIVTNNLAAYEAAKEKLKGES